MWPFRKSELTPVGRSVVASIEGGEGWKANSHYLQHRSGLCFFVLGGCSALRQCDETFPRMSLSHGDRLAIWAAYEKCSAVMLLNALSPSAATASKAREPETDVREAKQ